MSETTLHDRPSRDEVLEMARRVYPGATDQRLMECLFVYTTYPFGSFDKWRIDLEKEKRDASTVFTP